MARITISIGMLAGSPGVVGMAPPPKTPDIAAQRAAMEKLGFLVGERKNPMSQNRDMGYPLRGFGSEFLFRVDLEGEGVLAGGGCGQFYVERIGCLLEGDLIF
jgi:hypothetical protein